MIARILIASSLLFVSACAQRDSFPVLQQLTPQPDEGYCRLAVMPLVNHTKYRDGEILFYRMFIAELDKLEGVVLSPEGDVRGAYRQIRVTSGYETPTLDQLRIVGNYLDVPVVIIGDILEMGEQKISRNDTTPHMTVELKFIHVESGTTLGTIYHKRSGDEYRKIMHFGLVNTQTNLAIIISKEIITRLVSEGYFEQCSK